MIFTEKCLFLLNGKVRITCSLFFILYSLFFILCAASAATTPSTRGKSVIQAGTTVRQKVAATNLYSQECYDAYYGCMDQFCIIDNSSGGSCACSDENENYERQLTDIKTILANAENIATIEVERIQAGAQADIIFGEGERRYDAQGNVMKAESVLAEEKKAQQRTDLLASLRRPLASDDEEESIDNISNKKGSALYVAADEMCLSSMPDSCAKDVTFLKQMYSSNIKSDCKAFENDIAKQKIDADDKLAAAQVEVRNALGESFKTANAYDRGQCMVHFRNCMKEDEACGSDWSKCVSTIASENMQNQQATSTANTLVKNATKESIFDITESTLAILESKRNWCEKVLNQCMAVRDMVWPDFLKEAAPTIKVAELAAESKMRQSCLTSVSTCIQNACKDDIAGKGVDTMDSCLARPDMARSFCKVEVDTCERMEPEIWGYVVDKLAAMRVDACNDEVKSFMNSECGEDFAGCAGIDYSYMHDRIDTRLKSGYFVVCKQNNPKITVNDIDDIVRGLYLNMDNAILENCQNTIDKKMTELCGSTTDCNAFITDDTIGTRSLRAQKDGNVYRVTGMLSFGNINIGRPNARIIDAGEDSKTTLQPGELGVNEYMANVRERHKNAHDAEIISSIESEITSIAEKVNNVIHTLETDPEISFCTHGRDMSQITGRANETTSARFPHLLDAVKMQIAISALNKAEENYNEKFNREIATATKDASADLAQYMCQKIAEHGGAGALGDLNVSTPLTPPYAISYDVGSGLSTEDLAKGGAGVLKAGGATFKNGGYLGGASFSGGGMTKETTAIFSRDTRNCHICSTTMTESCKTSGSSSWFHNSRKVSCEVKASDQKCEDIVM